MVAIEGNKTKSETEEVNKSITSSTSPDEGGNYNKYIISALVVAIFVAGFYCINFFGNGLSKIPSDWGVLGDYVGGILNPALAFITIVLLVHTIKQQHIAIKQTATALQQSEKALNQSKAELKLSRQALIDNAKALELNQKELTIANQTYKEQSASFKQQNEYIQRQNFENHFFSLLSMVEKAINTFKINNTESASYHQFEQLYNRIAKRFKECPKYIAGDHDGGQSQNNLETDFFNEIMIKKKLPALLSVQEKLIYNILLYIWESSIVDEEQKWVGILKSIINNNQLLLLHLNCSTCEVLNDKLIHLYEEFHFFSDIVPSEEGMRLYKYAMSKERVSNRAFNL